MIIKSEFRIANHVIGTSVEVDCDSEYILKIIMPQTMIKLRPRTIFQNKISVNVFLNKLIRTYVITNNGTIVTEISIILKISAELPSKNLSVKSLVYKGKEPAPCSKAAQKKTVKRQKIVKTIILSRTIGVYLGILTINNVINEIKATRAKNNEFSIPK